jgi:hypothetical protein
MWADVPQMEQDVNALLNEAVGLRYFTVGKELHEETIARLDALAKEIEAFRKRAQEQKEEEAANLAFAFLQYVVGTTCLLSMWVQLKEDCPDDACVSIVNAQRAIECGLRLLPNDAFQQVSELLHFLEHVLFPPQLFSSIAHQYGWAECSICGQTYGDCDHLAGQLYMGQMCAKVIREISHVDHVAIVRNPADKALRIPAWPDGDKVRCTLTRRVVGENDGKIQGVPILRANG